MQESPRRPERSLPPLPNLPNRPKGAQRSPAPATPPRVSHRRGLARLRRPSPPPDWDAHLPPEAPDRAPADAAAEVEALGTATYQERLRRREPPPLSDRAQFMLRRLTMLESMQPQFDLFAFLPAAGWGAFTVLGCLWHGSYGSAVMVAAGVGTFAAMVFATRGSMRWQNVAIGFTLCIFGIVLLGAVGQVGVNNAGRTLGFLISLLPHRERHGGLYSSPSYTYSPPTPAPAPYWYDWVLTLPVLALIGLSVYCGWILYSYLGMHRERCELRDRLDEMSGGGG